MSLRPFVRQTRPSNRKALDPLAPLTTAGHCLYRTSPPMNSRRAVGVPGLARQDSNLRQFPCERNALPAELLASAGVGRIWSGWQDSNLRPSVMTHCGPYMRSFSMPSGITDSLPLSYTRSYCLENHTPFQPSRLAFFTVRQIAILQGRERGGAQKVCSSLKLHNSSSPTARPRLATSGQATCWRISKACSKKNNPTSSASRICRFRETERQS